MTRRALVLTCQMSAAVLLVLAACGDWKVAAGTDAKPLPGTRSAAPMACDRAGVETVETVDSIPKVEFVFHEGVTSSDRVRTERGILMGQAFIDRMFGGRESPTCVQVVINAEEAYSAKAGSETVIVYTTPTGWSKGFPDWHLQRVVAHEYAHLWQQEFTRRQRVTWLDEGAAEFISYRSIIDAEIAADGPTREYALRYARSPENGPLEMYEDGATAPSYGLFYLATDYLVATSGVEALWIYYEELATLGNWRSAFESAFGVSPQGFYDDFEIYRSNGFRR